MLVLARSRRIPTPRMIPTSTAIAYGAAWAYQRQAIRRQASSFDEAPRQAGIRRLYTHLVALIALLVLASGVGGLLWTLGDVVLGAAATSSGDGWRGGVALYSTLVVVGLPVWLLHWRPVPASPAEAQSLARRLYVYLSLIAAMLSLLGSGGDAVYRLIGLALGEGSTIGVLTDLAHALAVAVVATLVAVYHWRVLRSDTLRARASAESAEAATPAEAVETVEPVAPEPAEALVQIRAADRATLERALDMLRATGIEVLSMAPVQ